MVEEEITAGQETDLQDWEELAFRLLSVQAVKGADEVNLPQQLALSYALIVVTGGTVQLLADTGLLELTAGSVCLSLPGQTFGAVEQSGGLEMYIFISMYINTVRKMREAG